MKGLFAAILFMAALFALPQGASAHATPLEYTPASSVVVQEPPSTIDILFSERVEEGASSIQVYSPDGEKVELPPAKVDEANERLFSLVFDAVQEGTYTVSWQVVSADDGHFTKGAFAFSLGSASAQTQTVGQIQVQHVTRIPQATATGLELLGHALLVGVFGFLLFVWQPLQRRYPAVGAQRGTLLRRIRILMVLGVLCAVLGAVGFVVIKTLDLQDLRPGTFVQTLEVFAMTTDGSFALLRAGLSLGAALLLWLRLTSFVEGTSGRRILVLLSALLVGIVLARARVSHAAASEFLPVFSVLVNALQLLAKQWWVGGVALLALTFPVLGRLADERIRLYAAALLSRALLASLAVVAVSGLYIMWLHGKDLSLSWGEEWTQRALLVILGVAGMGVLRLAHMGMERLGTRTTTFLKIGLPVEAILGVALLFITGVSILTTPFYPGEQFAFERRSQSQGVEILLSVHPYRSESFLVRALDEETGEEVDVESIVISLENTQAGIGPLVVDPEQISSGGFILPRSELGVSGEWVIAVSVRHGSGYDATARFSLVHPDEVIASSTNASQRQLGPLEALLLALSVFTIGGTIFLRRFVRGTLTKIGAMREGVRPLPMNIFVSIGATIGFITIILFLGAAVHAQVLKTEFQKRCQENGDFWIQSVPMRDYQALAPRNVTGCTLSAGLYHFASQQEYEFFRDDTQVLAQLQASPEDVVAGEETSLFVQLSELRDGRIVGPASNIDIYHDRVVHAIVIGEDLETFAHIHPEDNGDISEEAKEQGLYELRHTFPQAGWYVVAVDYVRGGVEWQELFPVEVRGEIRMDRAEQDFSREKTFGEYEVSLHAPQRFEAGQEVEFSYTIRKNGAEVDDLQPYLAAAMHIFAVRDDLRRGTHTHGEVYSPGSLTVQKYLQRAGLGNYHTHFVPEEFGPHVEAGVSTPFVFPSSGTYTLFGEFRHEGEVVATSFTVEVE